MRLVIAVELYDWYKLIRRYGGVAWLRIRFERMIMYPQE